jgi:hypothetical protein
MSNYNAAQSRALSECAGGCNIKTTFSISGRQTRPQHDEVSSAKPDASSAPLPIGSDASENSTQAPSTNDQVIAALLKNLKRENAKTGDCAKYVTNALQQAGIHVTKMPSAYLLGPFLERAGYEQLPPGSYTPSAFRKGDIVVFEPVSGEHSTEGKHGHVAVYDGQFWLSDFAQRYFLPRIEYRTVSYSVYRRRQ